MVGVNVVSGWRRKSVERGYNGGYDNRVGGVGAYIVGRPFLPAFATRRELFTWAMRSLVFIRVVRSPGTRTLDVHDRRCPG